MFVNFVVFVAFVLSFEVNAVVHVLQIATKSEDKPLVTERFANVNSNSNGSGNNTNILSREVINHVRHKHEQTIGNVHIVTNIDIANLITILNTSTPISGQSINVPSTTSPVAVAVPTVPGKSGSLRQKYSNVITVLLMSVVLEVCCSA